MRTDQFENFRRLGELLADEFVIEANPNQWPTDEDERQKRKRTALTTLTLLCRLSGMVEIIQKKNTAALESEALENELDDEIRSAERETSRLLVRIQAGTSERNN